MREDECFWYESDEQPVNSNRLIRLYYHFLKLAIVNSCLDYKMGHKCLSACRKSMELVNFIRYVGESLSSAATANRKIVYSSDTEDEDPTENLSNEAKRFRF